MRRAIILPFLLLSLLFQASANAHAQTKLDTSIRRIDWVKFLDQDTAEFERNDWDGTDIPSFTIRASQPTDPNADPEQYDGKGGHFSLALYTDFNHDGKEDAALFLYAGGTGQFGAYVVMLMTDNGPKVAGFGGGPHIDVSLHHDTLISLTSYPLPNDPDCCARAMLVDRVIVEHDRVRHLDSLIEPVEGAGQQAVQDFYLALDRREFKYCYSVLSKTYRAKHPYAAWVAGYATMQSVEVEIVENSTDSVVHVSIKSIDLAKKKKLTRNFTGTWHTFWSPEDQTWYLDNPRIAEGNSPLD